MNHAQIAAEGIRFRLSMLGLDDASPLRVDPATAAHTAVTCGDVAIDSAIRKICNAWTSAGLDPQALVARWSGPGVQDLFCSRPDLVDALDDILHRVMMQPV